MRSSPFASSSVRGHLVRGLVGLLALVGAVVGTGLIGPAALVLLVVSVVAWRGCPTCWAVGLGETRRACAVRPPARSS